MNCDPLARWYRWLEYLGMGRALERRRFEFLGELARGIDRGAGEDVAPDRCSTVAGRERPHRERSGVLLPRPAGEKTACGMGERQPESQSRCASEGLSSRPEVTIHPPPTATANHSVHSGELAPADKQNFHALVLGDGDGRFLERLLIVQPSLRVDYVDSSVEMLGLARQRVAARLGAEQAGKRVSFHHVDARDWLPAEGRRYDLVCTHFFLDCLTGAEVDELSRRLVPFTMPTAAWIVSEFHQPPGGFAAWRAKIWIGGLYRLFGLATGLKVRRLPDYRRSLQAHGFRLEREVQAERGLLVSEWWQRER